MDSTVQSKLQEPKQTIADLCWTGNTQMGFYCLSTNADESSETETKQKKFRPESQNNELIDTKMTWRLQMIYIKYWQGQHHNSTHDVFL